MEEKIDARIEIRVADITTLDVGAIVNAANEALAPGGGVCGAIHAAAGPELARACEMLDGCPTGDARITEGYDLPARHVIHAVGPRWHGGDAGEPALLASCYESSLRLAEVHGLDAIAFPAISTGIFGYPLQDATRIAVETARAWLAAHARPRGVIFCCFREEDAAVYRAALGR